MNIITGYRGVGHIYSHHDRSINVSIYGDGTHILDVGSQMAATVISANEVQIADGLLVAEGCTAEVARGTTESLTIENGSQGMLRKDLIVVQYTRDSGTGVEGMNLAVIKGVAAASNPATPAHTTGSIADGDSFVEFPLYLVNINGISITSVDALADVVNVAGKLAEHDEAIEEQAEAIDNLGLTVGGMKISVINAPLGTMTFNSAGATGGTVDVSSHIPAGYSMIGAIPASSGYFGAYFYTCSAASATTVYVQLMRISGTQASTTPVVKLLCTKNL